jgi:hypothetical protein
MPSSVSPSSGLEPLDSCSASSSASSWCQQAVEALYAAVDAKQALVSAEQLYRQALEQLDALVEQGLLGTENLPLVHGFVVYRQPGRTSWSYPESIKQLEAQVKQQKRLCEQLGEASQKQGSPFWTIKEAERVF